MERSLVEGRRLELSTKCVLVLGGAGMVGKAVCRQLLNECPRKLVVHSLGAESQDTVDYLEHIQAGRPHQTEIDSELGNIFVREELRTKTRAELLNQAENRAKIIEDVLSELSKETLERMAFWKLIERQRPEIVIDCINTATAIAYQNIYQAANSVRRKLNSSNQTSTSEFKDDVERLLCSLYVPQLVKHVQVLSATLKSFKTEFYLKIGTTGTGGMGLNIPYTHGEEKPSGQLMSKTAMAGAHTLLLYLMHATPEPPITREIKPSAAVAWKEIGYGEIRKKGEPIELYDCDLSNPISCRIGEELKHRMEKDSKITPLIDDQGERERLQAVFIDTGENGLFSHGEFTAITTQNQMEFVTPEEIAANVIYEIRGSNTGSDVLGAIRSATMGPSYRAGFMRSLALRQIRSVERTYKAPEGIEDERESIAFEILGPPKLSKLLFEAYLLKRKYGTISSVLNTAADVIRDDLLELLRNHPRLRAKIISVGIPILLPDGINLVRGKEISTPDFGGRDSIAIEDSLIDVWAKQGWVDLRESNWIWWLEKLRRLENEIGIIPDLDQYAKSSFASRTKNFWTDEIDIGELVGWIFIHEEKGGRRGYQN